MKKTNKFRVLLAVAMAAVLAVAMTSCGEGDPEEPLKNLAGTIEFKTYATITGDYGMMGVPITAVYTGDETVTFEWFFEENSLSKNATYTPDNVKLSDFDNFIAGYDTTRGSSITVVVSALGYKELDLDIEIKVKPEYSNYFGKWTRHVGAANAGYNEWITIWEDEIQMLSDDTYADGTVDELKMKVSGAWESIPPAALAGSGKNTGWKVTLEYPYHRVNYNNTMGSGSAGGGWTTWNTGNTSFFTYFMTNTDNDSILRSYRSNTSVSGDDYTRVE